MGGPLVLQANNDAYTSCNTGGSACTRSRSFDPDPCCCQWPAHPSGVLLPGLNLMLVNTVGYLASLGWVGRYLPWRVGVAGQTSVHGHVYICV